MEIIEVTEQIEIIGKIVNIDVKNIKITDIPLCILLIALRNDLFITVCILKLNGFSQIDSSRQKGKKK